MKKSLSVLALIALSSSAFADIPPSPGQTISTEIDGVAASIVMEHITNSTSSRKFPALIGSIPHRDGSMITGPENAQVAVSEQNTAGAESAIACVSYYYRGRVGICKLVKKFK